MATINDPMEDAQEQEGQQSDQEQAGQIPEFGGGSGVADARASTGTSVGGAGAARKAPKPTSSGSFQDFSAFQAANKTNIQNMGDQVAQDAAGARKSGEKAIDKGVAGARSTVNQNLQDPSKVGTITADNLVSKKDDIAKFLNTSVDPEAVTRAATEKIAKGFDTYKESISPYQEAKDLTGVNKLFKETGPDRSNIAAAGDALLFRSNVDARNKLAEQQQKTAEFDPKATREEALANVGTSVEDMIKANADAQESVRGQLGGVNRQIQDTIASREKSIENRLYQEAVNNLLAKTQGLSSNYIDRSTMDVMSDSMNQGFGAPGTLNLPTGFKDVAPAEFRGDIFANMTQQELVNALGGEEALRRSLGIDNLVQGANVVSSDPSLRATLDALAGLGMGGNIYQDAATADSLSGAEAGNLGFQNLSSEIQKYVDRKNAERIAASKVKDQEDMARAVETQNVLNPLGAPGTLNLPTGF